jgi:hypothetical protein
MKIPSSHLPAALCRDHADRGPAKQNSSIPAAVASSAVGVFGNGRETVSIMGVAPRKTWDDIPPAPGAVKSESQIPGEPGAKGG